IAGRRGPEFVSTMTDLEILANLARFHARRSRAAVQYTLFTMTRDAAALDAAIAGERAALDAWRAIVVAAGDQYTFNLAMGACNYSLCGHWRDEVPKLEAGLAQLESQRTSAPGAVAEIRAKPDRSLPV